jgi:hypothetical protein
LPASIARLLTDSLHRDHPDVPWSPPANLPPENELRKAVRICQQRLSPVDPKVAGFCLAKLAIAYEANSKMEEDIAVLRTQVWLEVNGDLPQDLWEDATIETLRTSKWLPKPAEFRALVMRRFTTRQVELERALKLLDLKGKPLEEQPVEAAPLPERYRQSARHWRKVGDIAKAEHFERAAEKAEA